MMPDARRTRPKSRLDDESGATLVFLAIALIPLIALLALCVDGYALLVSKLEQENNAEFAAIAAVNDSLDATTGLISDNQTRVRTRRAEQVAGSNTYLGNRAAQPVDNNEIENGSAGQMVAGYFDKNTRQFFASGRCAADGKIELNAVKLSLNTIDRAGRDKGTAMMPIFSRFFGYQELAMKSTVIAYHDFDRKITAVAPVDSGITVRNGYDINGDNVVTDADRLTLAAFLSRPSLLLSGFSTSARGSECYDLDGNGTVNLTDLSTMQIYLRDQSNQKKG